MKQTTIKEGRLRSDLIEMYKVVNEPRADWLDTQFSESEIKSSMGIRWNSRTIWRESFKSKSRNNFTHLITVKTFLSE